MEEFITVVVFIFLFVFFFALYATDTSNKNNSEKQEKNDTWYQAPSTLSEKDISHQSLNSLTEKELRQKLLDLDREYKDRIEAIYTRHAKTVSALKSQNKDLRSENEALTRSAKQKTDSYSDAAEQRILIKEKEAFSVKSSHLSTAEGRQAELDRYKKHDKTSWEIGLEYERYIGYLYEQKGLDVSYAGASLGLRDMGRDLIVKSGERIQVVQCKCWGHEKTLREKHIFQLYGSTAMFQLQNPKASTQAVFFTSASLSDTAKECADALNVKYHEQIPLQKHPLVKCNISAARGKVYFLPFDKDYDQISMIPNKGDLYVDTVKEAEQRGFRYTTEKSIK